MKILFYSSYFYPYVSGMTTYPLRLFTYLQKKHNITTLTFPHKNNLKKEEYISSIKVLRMPYLIKLSKGYISPQSTAYFIRELKDADIVLMNIPNAEGLPLVIFAKLMGKRIVSLFHCQVTLGNRFLDKIINAFLNTSVFSQLALSDIIIGYTKDYVKSITMLKRFQKKIKIVLPLIEQLSVDKKTKEKLLLLKKKNIWIGFSGRIAAEKGIEYLIDALIKLRQKKLPVELVIAGPYGKEVAGEIKYYQIIKKLLIEKRLPHRFLGKLEGEKLGAFYESIDILVLPSINSSEAFGIVQVEAMLLGTPVVATDLPGVRVPINLTGMGEIAKRRNAKDLAKKISKVFNDRKRYIKNKHIIKKIFASKETIEQYGKILTSIS